MTLIARFGNCCYYPYLHDSIITLIGKAYPPPLLLSPSLVFLGGYVFVC